jgi:hypothetical protein
MLLGLAFAPLAEAAAALTTVQVTILLIPVV